MKIPSLPFSMFLILLVLFLVGCEASTSENRLENNEFQLAALENAKKELSAAKKRSLELKEIERELTEKLSERDVAGGRIEVDLSPYLTKNEIRARIQEIKTEKAESIKFNLEKKAEIKQLKEKLAMKEKTKVKEVNK